MAKEISKTPTEVQESKFRELIDQLSPSTKKRVARYLVTVGKLKGLDQTYAMVSTFSHILNDLGKLESVISREEFNDAIGVFDLAINWDNTSDINKYIGVAKQSINLANKYAGANIEFPGDVLGLASIGYSQSQLIDNWSKYNNIQKFVGLANTVSNVNNAYNLYTNINTAAQATATTGATTAASAANAASVANASSSGGAIATSEIAGSAGTVGTDGVAVAGAEAGATSGLQMAAQVAGVVAAAYGAYTMYENFGEGGAGGRLSGASSGAAMGAMFGPWGAAIGTVLGLAVGSVKTGKSKEQGARDSYRDYFKEVGLFTQFKDVDSTEEEFSILNEDAGKAFGEMHLLQLADGSYYQVGVDGKEGRATYKGEKKTFSDESKILAKDKGNIANGNEIRPYEIDYTNDLDFFSVHSLTALKYIMGGGSDRSKESGEFDQMFGYLANGATSNTSSREFTQENFDITMRNIRAMYSKAGVNNSDQAYNMLNQLKAEGKINEEQFQIAAQSVRISFNNDFEYANELNSTRFEGVETVSEENNFVESGEPFDEEQDTDSIERPEVSDTTDLEDVTSKEALPEFNPEGQEIVPTERPTPSKEGNSVEIKDEFLNDSGQALINSLGEGGLEGLNSSDVQADPFFSADSFGNRISPEIKEKLSSNAISLAGTGRT